MRPIAVTDACHKNMKESLLSWGEANNLERRVTDNTATASSLANELHMKL